eukprot:4568965-Pleurochrysis_carterae.AAC.4
MPRAVHSLSKNWLTKPLRNAKSAHRVCVRVECVRVKCRRACAESCPGAAATGSFGWVTGVMMRLRTRDMRPRLPMASATCGMASLAALAAVLTRSACSGSLATPTNLASAAAP